MRVRGSECVGSAEIEETSVSNQSARAGLQRAAFVPHWLNLKNKTPLNNVFVGGCLYTLLCFSHEKVSTPFTPCKGERDCEFECECEFQRAACARLSKRGCVFACGECVDVCTYVRMNVCVYRHTC